MKRRSFLASVAAAGLSSAAAARQPASAPRVSQRGGVELPPPAAPRRSRFRQALMRFNFGADTKLSFDDMCREAARLGYAGFDLAGPPDWPTLRKHGLICTMAPLVGTTIADGVIRPELHDRIEKALHEEIDLCAANGYPNIVSVGGERRGLDPEVGKDRAVALFNRVKAHAEDKGVTICMEIVNSKYKDPAFGRADAIFDRLAWGADVCRRVGSPRVKILFDIYHVQIAEGDVCASIREYYPLIAHFHTAGVPGRREIDDTQELNYRFIAQTIADLGFTGYIAHEYRPTPGRDPIESLRRNYPIMDV